MSFSHAVISEDGNLLDWRHYLSHTLINVGEQRRSHKASSPDRKGETHIHPHVQYCILGESLPVYHNHMKNFHGKEGQRGVCLNTNIGNDLATCPSLPFMGFNGVTPLVSW
jgi:hypothetical protein